MRGKLKLIPIVLILISCVLLSFACDKGGESDLPLGTVFTIMFDSNGGEGDATVQYTVGQPFVMPEDATREGYTFLGWYTTAEDTEESTGTVFTATTPITADGLVYARWSDPITYYITYETNGGRLSSKAATSYTAAATVSLMSPSKTGFTFAGWYASENLSGSAIASTKRRTGDLALYARWVDTLTITYELNGGVNSPNNVSNFSEISENVKLSAPTREGFEFAGWYANEALEGDAMEYVPKGTKAGVTVYAKWEPAFAITYELDGGVNNDKNPTYYTAKTDAITLEAPKKDGFTFVGWYADSAYTTALEENALDLSSDAAISVYAKWSEPLVFTITYELNKAEADAEKPELDLGTNNPANPTEFTSVTEDIILAAPTKSGFVFKGWYATASFRGDAVTTVPKGTASNVELFAKWEQAYNITYVMNGGENSPANPAYVLASDADITLARPGRKGYNFIGWFSDAELTADKQLTVIKKGTSAEQTVYAKWSAPIVYTITYDLDNGALPTALPKEYTVESDAIVLTAPEKAGYEFRGWFSSSFFREDQSISAISKGSVGNLTLFVKFVRINNITYWEKSGNTPVGIRFADNIAHNYPKTFTIEDDTIALAPLPDGSSTFGGWYDNENFTGTPVTEIVTTVEKDYNVYAKWIKYYVIDYRLDGGENVYGNPDRFTEDDPTIILKNPYKVSNNMEYKFLGWYSEHTFINKVTEIPTGTTRAVTLYAHWQQTATPIEKATINTDTQTITYGKYPQTLVTDTALLSILKANYTADSTTGWYTYMGATYARVIASPFGVSYSFDNGEAIASGKQYYFHVEPIRWNILNKAGDNYTITTDLLLDSTIYNDSTAQTTSGNSVKYANNWEESSLRQWLANEFYTKAFTAYENDIIQQVTVDNSAVSNTLFPVYANGANTTDKVYAISDREVETSTSFNTAASVTDYAKACGACVTGGNKGSWWMRSSGEYGTTAMVVDGNGAYGAASSTTVTNQGVCVRPVIVISYVFPS